MEQDRAPGIVMSTFAKQLKVARECASYTISWGPISQFGMSLNASPLKVHQSEAKSQNSMRETGLKCQSAAASSDDFVQLCQIKLTESTGAML
jgi:hypothetical protein